jgi:hypothetical protein
VEFKNSLKQFTSQILQTRAAYLWHPARKNHSTLLKRIWIQQNNKRNDEDDDDDNDNNNNNNYNNNNNNSNARMSIFTTKVTLIRSKQVSVV